MSAVMIELTPRPEPVEDDAVVLVEDVEELSAFNRCSCSASDDAPYQ
jgi:hypothetical protein